MKIYYKIFILLLLDLFIMGQVGCPGCGGSSSVDTVSPTVVITYPPNTSTVSGVITIKASASDNLRVVKVEFYIDGSKIGEDTSSPYECDWNTDTLQYNSQHTIQAKAYDNAGNIGESAIITVTVGDPNAPEVTITNPQDGAIVSGIVTIQVQVIERGKKFKAPSGIEKVEFYVDGSKIGEDTLVPYEYSFDTALYSAGSHVILVKAYDISGNCGEDSIVVGKDYLLRWRYQTGDYITSSPAIGEDGTIYVGGWDNCLYAINPDGTLRWKYSFGNVYSSPAIGEDGTIYVKMWDWDLYAIDSNGNLKWVYNLNLDLPYYGASSPAIGEDGTIYVGDHISGLYALTPQGSLIWKYGQGWDMASSPVVAENGVIYIAKIINGNSFLCAVNPDGSSKWECDLGYSYGASSPAIGEDGTIYVGSNNFLYAVNSNGTQKWRYQTGYYITSSPAIGEDGTIYVGGWDDYLYAINPDGTLKWRYLTGGDIMSSPAIGEDGTIYVGSEDHYLYAINPDGTLKWRYLTGGGINSSPAIGEDGTIYVGSRDRYLYAIKTLSFGLINSSWPKFRHDNKNTGRSR